MAVLDERDLRVDIYKTSGVYPNNHGTVTVTHVPTGLHDVVEFSDKGPVGVFAAKWIAMGRLSLAVELLE